MSIHDALVNVLRRYKQATRETFAQHPIARFLRNDARAALEEALGEYGRGLKIVGSAGAGNWATVPWLGVFDGTVTQSATQGYYVVYLFHSDAPIVHLSMNQGTTAIREEFGASAREIMRDRANLMRRRVSDLTGSITVERISLGSSQELPRDYEAAHMLGVMYELESMPPESVLRADLQEMVRIYRALTFRGGFEPSAEHSEEGGATLEESRRYRFHRRIERNPSASKLAKKFHGARCQACNFDFAARYGSIGEGYIEAHHLRPLSSLQEGIIVTYDSAVDFAVLCSNCDRMIHRWPDPADLEGFKAALESRQVRR